MSKYEVGDAVTVRAFVGTDYWSGTVMKIGRGLFGRRYLVKYGVHDLDFNYHTTAMNWFSERRLV